jgi:hypoxanthine phosphoribosyltransferase
MTMTDYDTILSQSDLLFDEEQIEQAITDMAMQINDDYEDAFPIIICVMTGALMTAGRLMTQLTFPLTLDYIHATRYGEKTVGGTLDWKVEPHQPLNDRHVLLVEDIFDQGVTLEAIREYCEAAGAASVKCACLFDKQVAAKEYRTPEYVGLVIPDRYVYGYGLDKSGLWRNLPALYALKETD